MDWAKTLDAAEKKLAPIVGEKLAYRLTCLADGHAPWFEIARDRKRKLTEADVNRLVEWLLERKDEKDFRP